ncbi:MAG: MarR family transcriptional regulator [Candidatus Omnitrophica bacterium]|nr:MarR family transcriptional regulator [Candidatus Omnitrophota bacterium]
MKVKKFAMEVAAAIPHIHSELVRSQPGELMRGKITFTQMIILDILRVRGECKMSDISNLLKVTKSAVTGITDRLIKLELIYRTRSRQDRRVVRIKLAPRGSHLATRLYSYKLKIISTLFSNISQRERAQYLHILKKLQQNIQARKRTRTNA